MDVNPPIPKISMCLFALIIGFLVSGAAYGQRINLHESREIIVGKNTYWWAGVVHHGNRMPLIAPYQANLNSNYGNQVQPLMLSSTGEVIWSDHPYQITFSPGTLRIEGPVQYYEGSGTLRDAYRYASRTYFPPSGKMPDSRLFTHPQYNTWIELMYDQNEKDVLAYARGILAHGLPPGVLMIDDNWQEDYGKWNFHAGRFPHPGKMIDDLHDMGFNVMVWVCPFVSPDCDAYRDLMRKKCLVTDQNGEPAIVRWWNGASALLDLTNPEAFNWFKSQLDRLIADYGVDGFKFDGGDVEYYEGVHSFKQDTRPEDHSEVYGKMGLFYPLNEYRAMWKMGGQPLAERLRDKGHSFEDLQLLIPNMLTAGLMGYYFSCPDMIGGGEFTAFMDDAVLDQELIVRSAQCHALMPMMQFSVAPWRVLDERHFAAVKRSVAMREQYTEYILELAVQAAETGEPIMRPMEYAYPKQGYAGIIDQFLLGDRLLVAPVVNKGAAGRQVVLPEGRWKSVDGEIISGPQTVDANSGLDDLPVFELVE